MLYSVDSDLTRYLKKVPFKMREAKRRVVVNGEGWGEIAVRKCLFFDAEIPCVWAPAQRRRWEGRWGGSLLTASDSNGDGQPARELGGSL